MTDEEARATPDSPTPPPEDDPNKGKIRPRKTRPKLVSAGDPNDPTKMKVENEEVKQPKGPFVIYRGMATTRILTPADWERVSVDDTDHKTYVWGIQNAKRIPVSEFSPKQLDYLRVDGRFEIEEG